jgi:hypothetical protein
VGHIKSAGVQCAACVHCELDSPVVDLKCRIDQPCAGII